MVTCYLQFLAINIEHKLWQIYVLQKVCVICVDFLYYEHELQNNVFIKPKIKYFKVFREWIMLIFEVTF